jgi:hypothetical protein
MDWVFSAAEVMAMLPEEPGAMRFHYALRHGTMNLAR